MPPKYKEIVPWFRQTKGSLDLAVRLGACAHTSPEAAPRESWLGRQDGSAGSGSAFAPQEQTLHLVELHWLPDPLTPTADAQPMTPDEPCTTLTSSANVPIFFSYFYFSCRKIIYTYLCCFFFSWLPEQLTALSQKPLSVILHFLSLCRLVSELFFSSLSKVTQLSHNRAGPGYWVHEPSVHEAHAGAGKFTGGRNSYRWRVILWRRKLCRASPGPLGQIYK